MKLIVPVRRVGAPTIRTPGMPVSRLIVPRTRTFPGCQSGKRAIESLAPISFSCNQIGQVVHGGGDAGHVGQSMGAELKTIRHLVGRRLKLVGSQRLQKLRGRHDASGMRTAPLVGGDGNQVGTQ